MSFLHEAAIFLAGAIIAVTLFNKLGFGSVLGYLVAGVVIGPWALGLITDVEHIFHFSELGVVLLLFLIGLELQPSRLWVLRKSIFGLGLAQVLITAMVLIVVGETLGLSLNTAVIVSLGLSLSSTAFVLQMLAERKQLNTLHGKSAFSILLFQDLAVVPLLALLPLLGVNEISDTVASASQGVVTAVAAIVVLVVGGHYLLRPVFRLVASSGSNEIFTATSLMIVIVSTLLMEIAGLSMALGAFVAGVLLADSEYRHEIEVNIEPFKGLLLGLFFIAVGMSVNIGLLSEKPLEILGLVLGLMAIKFIVLYVLGRITKLPARCSRNLAFVLPQGGEFAFVIFTAATAYQVLDQDLTETLILVVSMSMAITPLLFLFNETLLKSWFDHKHKPAPFDRIDEPGNQVIIAGFGRVGQIVGRMLRVKNIPFTALEVSTKQVDFVRKFGGKLYYGDARKVELLRSAHAEQSSIFVLAIGNVDASLKTAETVKKHFPHLKIVARAVNRHHAHMLMDLGIDCFIRETYFSSLKLVEKVLYALEIDEREIIDSIEKFKRHDWATLLKQHAIHHDESQLIQSVKESVAELQELFEMDLQSQDTNADDK
ncbi:MAG: monovalent cation:proton antiporter-2 (CPA2) family protein [Gammaproteobacteria bacterium]